MKIEATEIRVQAEGPPNVLKTNHLTVGNWD